jgi:hypothetical protein
MYSTALTATAAKKMLPVKTDAFIFGSQKKGVCFWFLPTPVTFFFKERRNTNKHIILK